MTLSRQHTQASMVPYRSSISLALEHLTGLGHRHIGFVGPEYKLDDRRGRAPEVRRQLFVRLMGERGLLDEGVMLDCPREVSAAELCGRPD